MSTMYYEQKFGKFSVKNIERRKSDTQTAGSRFSSPAESLEKVQRLLHGKHGKGIYCLVDNSI